MSYTPSKQMLKKYASVLVDFALGSGEGIKKNEVIYLQFDIDALPLALETYQRILEKGAHPIVKMHEETFSKIFYKTAQDHQLEFFPKKYSKALVDTMDHRIYIMAERDPFLLKDVPPQKLMKGQKQRQVMKKWLFDKEDQGKMTWVLALYGTEGMAKEANLNLKDFWEQIVQACFLDLQDPIAQWHRVFKDLEHIRGKLNALKIQKLHIKAKDTDLWVPLGDTRQFVGGSGRNIPSFELFTSPDWRGMEGHIFFDYPLYRYGNIVKDIRLEFKNGRVVKAQAAKNEKLIKELVKQKNADKVGEYSLTDIRHSHITKFMANTLFDENFGGTWGNTHLALGSSYHEAYTGKVEKMKTVDWNRLGFNESPEHTDIIATTDRVVEAHLPNGVKKIVYAKGQFQI